MKPKPECPKAAPCGGRTEVAGTRKNSKWPERKKWSIVLKPNETHTMTVSDAGKNSGREWRWRRSSIAVGNWDKGFSCSAKNFRAWGAEEGEDFCSFQVFCFWRSKAGQLASRRSGVLIWPDCVGPKKNAKKGPMFRALDMEVTNARASLLGYSWLCA